MYGQDLHAFLILVGVPGSCEDVYTNLITTTITRKCLVQLDGEVSNLCIVFPIILCHKAKDTDHATDDEVCLKLLPNYSIETIIKWCTRIVISICIIY